MTFDEYREEIINGNKVEWYETMVPEKLITRRVMAIADMMMEGITKLEGEITDHKKGSKERGGKERYLGSQLHTIRHLPFNNNGLIDDFYLVKYRKITDELEKEKPKETKPKRRTTRKPPVVDDEVVEEEPKVETEEKPKPVTKSRRGKNHDLIFGKK